MFEKCWLWKTFAPILEFQGAVKVPFDLPPGLSNEHVFRFAIQAINVPQKLRGTLTFLVEVIVNVSALFILSRLQIADWRRRCARKSRLSSQISLCFLHRSGYDWQVRLHWYSSSFVLFSLTYFATDSHNFSKPVAFVFHIDLLFV